MIENKHSNRHRSMSYIMVNAHTDGADSVRRFNAGRVLVLHNPPA